MLNATRADRKVALMMFFMLPLKQLPSCPTRVPCLAKRQNVLALVC